MNQTDESKLVPLDQHNQLTAGPAPWTDTRVPAEVFHVARAVYGSADLEDEKRVYRTIQGALWKLAADTPEGCTPADAKVLRAANHQLAIENDRLRGLKADLPPRPDHNNDASYQHPALPRYGLRWNGPGEPVAVPMQDGYWTPFHLALIAAA